MLLVSMTSGEITLLEGSSGCLSTTHVGPEIQDSSNFGLSSISFVDMGTSSNPSFTTDTYTGAQIALNPCGGVLHDETWSITYDETVGTWEVEGSVTGIQQNRAQAFTRYVPDRGEISFTITDGSLPVSDGDTFRFSVQSNLLQFATITNNQGRLEALEFPKAGIFYEDNGIQYAAVPIYGSDLIIRIDIEDWLITGIWN